MSHVKEPELDLSAAVTSISAPNRPQVESDPLLLECYQNLLTRLRKWQDASGKTSAMIGITSCGPGEGVSTVATHLAELAAQTLDLEVALLDARWSRPSLDHAMGISPSPGLGDYLNGTAGLSDCRYGTRLERLTVLPAGAADNGTPGDQDWSRVQTLCSELRREFGWIVVDLPPVTETGGWLSLASHLDGVLLVVAAEHVGDSTPRRAVEHLRRAGTHLLGAVINECQAAGRSGSNVGFR